MFFEIKEYIFSLQLEVQGQISNHNNIDDFLDNIFDKVGNRKGHLTPSYLSMVFLLK